MGQGAATSGQGLTALQVAAALKAAAEAKVKRSADASTAIRRTASGIEAYAKNIQPEDCHQTLELTVSAPGEAGSTASVHVTEYAPAVFSFLRRVEGVSEERFAQEWSLPEDRLKMELGEGRSQALFLKSKAMAFMCKTIAEEEVHVLLQVLWEYTQHIAANPSSLLMRFYLLMKVSVQEEVGYILCFNDVFGAASVLHEKWDIKGRIPKPGKYLYYPHLIRRAYEPDPYLIETPHNMDVVVTTNGGKDTAGEKVMNDTVVVKGAEDTMKLSTLHDKDLTRLFWLPQETRRRLLKQLFSDYDFLMKAGLMDYSLLIGVAYNETKTSRSGKRYVIENMKMASLPGERNKSPQAERRPSSPEGKTAKGDLADASTSETGSFSEYVNGVHSLNDQETYYIGIIDMLTTYSAKKKAANFFKSFLWEQDTLSTIPPNKYGKRVMSFSKLIFPEVDDEASAN
ncbi:phosphatidylinositol-4-phosphate 5-kinase-like protein [Leptomonas pyrrhocoris]|uniref:Phosphatidylinositol-4-phosphate 5-kinase-like protein n=1 Tax=Leptomonas pyrrhocoris TaxID=157538 RepID=A0A0M9G0I5_LEPPY|nr:phosphatidylinositol-4-phosphate 5-kinase-like protein [Leptomonas pyrrhocoris]KPA79865.1 phosphatidylinositol-4-phosphate 5-kinase-like protein [Leptomonas pyrrhocoris]|eukprot:XP_015658304.1 phosphatidylinositol-4-phosphate 5-kinase-like protein [Leptomonas pyrrhocoris]